MLCFRLCSPPQLCCVSVFRTYAVIPSRVDTIQVQDASIAGSSDDEDLLGVIRGPSTFANAFLYIGELAVCGVNVCDTFSNRFFISCHQQV